MLVKCDRWQVTHDTWHVTHDTWHLICYFIFLSKGATIRTRKEIHCLPYAGFFIESALGNMWHVTRDTWHMTHDTWHIQQKNPILLWCRCLYELYTFKCVQIWSCFGSYLLTGSIWFCANPPSLHFLDSNNALWCCHAMTWHDLRSNIWKRRNRRREWRKLSRKKEL